MAAGVLFVRRQLRRDEPMLDLRLFRHAPFAGGLVNNLVASTAYIGFLLLVSQHLQLVGAWRPWKPAQPRCRAPGTAGPRDRGAPSHRGPTPIAWCRPRPRGFPMRRTLAAAVLLALALTGCDDPQEEVVQDAPAPSPTSTFSPPPPVTEGPAPEPAPTGPGTGSDAPAPDQPGPESVPTPSAQLGGP